MGDGVSRRAFTGGLFGVLAGLGATAKAAITQEGPDPKLVEAVREGAANAQREQVEAFNDFVTARGEEALMEVERLGEELANATHIAKQSTEAIGILASEVEKGVIGDVSEVGPYWEQPKWRFFKDPDHYRSFEDFQWHRTQKPVEWSVTWGGPFYSKAIRDGRVINSYMSQGERVINYSLEMSFQTLKAAQVARDILRNPGNGSYLTVNDPDNRMSRLRLAGVRLVGGDAALWSGDTESIVNLHAAFEAKEAMVQVPWAKGDTINGMIVKDAQNCWRTESVLLPMCRTFGTHKKGGK